MKIIKINGRLTSEEKETHLSYDYMSKTWTMDTTIMKHYNKLNRYRSKKDVLLILLKYLYDFYFKHFDQRQMR